MKKNLQNRREFLKAAAMSVAVTGLAGCSEGLQSFAGKGGKPNLLFIMTDQQRSDALSIAGNTVLETPNLDRLARQGAYFKNAYTPCAVCCPARSSVLTGCTVENTRMRKNGLAYYPKEKGLMTMPTFDEILTGEGYRCEYYGKWHSLSSHTDIYKNPLRASKNEKSVFDHGGQKHVWIDYLKDKEPRRKLKAGQFYDNMSERPYKTDPMDKYHGKTLAELKAANKKVVQPDQHGELLMDKENTLTAFQAKQTIEAIERLKDKPFSITCSFHFPHSPILPTEPYYSMYPAKNMKPPVSIDDDMANSPYQGANGRGRLKEYRDKDKIKYMISNYYGLVKEIDDWMGEILNTLDKHGLTDKTLVIFVSDHGEMLGSHGMREKNVFYEESAHIPLLVRFPRQIKRNTKVDGYVSLVDLFATIMDYLKIKKHKSDGKSLRGLIEGTDSEHGKYVVTEWDYRGDVEPNYMILKDGWKMIIPYSTSSKVINALYDLNSDPHEMNNLIGKNPNRRRHVKKTEELRANLLEWLKKNGSSHYEGVRKRKLV
ncbi:MAG: sulfatase-like hydrolase/transferase [Planctomycetes bacterium]|nr:sulfatase-like hydrolase/transferase [Planctomycetota bacterium]